MFAIFVSLQEPEAEAQVVRPEDRVTCAPTFASIEGEIRAVLRPLMPDRDRRQARLTRAFAAYPGLLDRIATDGETGVFLSHLLQTLRDYGDVKPGLPAVAVLLESIRDEVGAGDRQYIDQILAGRETVPRGPVGTAQQQPSTHRSPRASA